MKKIILSSLFALSLINATAQDSLVVFYKLNYLNNTQDISGNNHNASVHGNSLLLTTDNCGTDSSASTFDTSIVVSDSSITSDISSGHTISMWVKFYPFAASGTIMKYGNIEIFYNSYYISYTNGVDTLNIANPLPTQWQWFNYTVTNDNSTIKAQTKLYSGTLNYATTVNTSTVLNISDTLKVGSISNYINSSMYNFALFNKALTSAQIDTLVSTCVSHVGVNEVNSVSENIHPNPASGIIFVSKQKENIFLYDLTGKLIKSEFSNTIDVSDISNGNYIISVNNTKTIVTINH